MKTIREDIEHQTIEKDLPRCPKCKRSWLDVRVPRAPWVKYLLFFLPIKRYKCYGCGKKSYIIQKSGK